MNSSACELIHLARRKLSLKSKVGKVIHEWKEGELHSGSDKGPKVKNQKQAAAIALSEARKAGGKMPPPLKKQ